MNINNNIQNTINAGNSSTSKPIFPPLKRPTTEQPLAQTNHKNFIDSPTHFETDYISMKWIPEKRRIDVIWKQFVSEEKVREVLLKEVAMIRHTKVKCLFLDAQKFKGTNPNIPRWANEVWSQMVHDAGLKHFATVVSDKDIFAVFSLKYGMGEKLTSLVNCAVFKTVEESEVWLRQYTHPENPTYSEGELEEGIEEYEDSHLSSLDNNFDSNNGTLENKADRANEENNFTSQIQEEEAKVVVNLEAEKVQHITIEENELESFDLKNEVTEQEIENNLEEEEQEEEENEAENSQLQVFANFEDLESHIQSIEAKHKMKKDSLENIDTSEVQS